MKKLLIANRGEIALRIQRAANALGIATVTVCSEADAKSLFARSAQELVVIGPPPPKDSYLHIERILDAAKRTGCDALHPGYGFLSENAEFAAAVRGAGMVWVGPKPESIELLGSKTAARDQAIRAGVPVTPGSKGGEDDAAITARARQIGYPVIIKAVGGGGGRGMRIANATEELSELLPRARAEALKNFGNGDVFIEKYIIEPRHVEVQLFGDNFGAVVHLGTRDCSTQRRHQKLVEEAPAPFLSAELRARIENAAVAVAKQVGYANAGTAEFLVSGEEFYFLEMNTRIQVEHPVTEAITGVDLVQLQLKVAEGAPLPFRQEDIQQRGHAIEFRIYAEDPANNFAPSIGPITEIVRVSEPFVREDFGFEAGDAITPYYDAMLSKVIVTGATRAEAIARSYSVLRRYSVSGVTGNLSFFRWLLRLSPFSARPLDIGYLERSFSAASLKELEVGELVDPRHIAPIAGAERIETVARRVGDREWMIRIMHLPEGIFEGALLDPSTGALSLPKFRRRSNSYATTVNALVDLAQELAAEPATAGQAFGGR